MKVGPLDVTFHRTVRVADGRSPSNLPPSLGRATVTSVSEYDANCPKSWDRTGYFIPLHDREALWISFQGGPVAVLIGAGGINALTGTKLGTKLEEGNYLVTPPQPWIDGWKAEDGTVYQFVATPFKGGDGLSVGEQILGEESKSGGIGIAVFEPKEPLKGVSRPDEVYTDSAWSSSYSKGVTGQSAAMYVASAARSRGLVASEMGVGKGGKIIQKIYADTHGLAVWKEEPAAAMAFYLVSAADYEAITGIKIPAPKSHDDYQGNWFNLKDESLEDSPGAPVFAGLKTVFAGDVSNVDGEAKATDK